MFRNFYEYAYHLPAFISFALLALQIALPWTVPHLTTMDGASHLYSATIVRDLLLHGSSSPYFPYYTLQPAIVPNWTGTLALSVAVSMVGVNQAEPLLMSAAMLAGFLVWGYVCRALSPGKSPWTPAANFLIQTWFLWTGYHSFYIGMLLLGFPIGYYVRHIARLTFRHAIGLAGGLLALFFTHLMPAIIAIVTLVMTCIWVNLFSAAGPNQPKSRQPGSSSRFGELVIVVFAVVPASLLTLLYLHAPATGFAFDPQLEWAWKEFPMHVFTVGGGRSGAQLFLWPCFLFFIVAGISSMTRSEWRSAKGGIAISTLFFFVVYLFAPDRGFNGTEVKVRLSWGCSYWGES